jgi:hemoglobin
MRHVPFVVDQAARDRWVLLMRNAFAEASLPEEPERKLREFLEQTATFLINRAA